MRLKSDDMKFNYKTVIDLGFQRENCNDSVFFDHNGYDWFLVMLKFSEKIYLDRDCETHEIELIRVDKDSHIKGRMKINDIDHLNEIITFYKD